MLAHRISCGALVVRDARILLVHHVRPGLHDFWVAPGGGVEGEEDLTTTAARETLEESGITVRIGAMAYIDELFIPGHRALKFWYLADYVSGTIDVKSNPADGESIIEAGWFDRAGLPPGPVFPDPLRTQFWDDLATGFPAPIKLPLRPLQR